MTPEFTLLDQLLRNAPNHSLWCADENVAGFMPSHFSGQIITNRYDLALGLCKHHPETLFNDFQLTECHRPLQEVIFRIAKEKAINIHIIQQSLALLPQGGKLHLLGYKNEGIGSLNNFYSETNAKIHRHKGQLFHIEIVSNGLFALKTDEYTPLQWIDSGQPGFYSKPGIFGWNKTDAGSELMMQLFNQYQQNNTSARVLDLGCGYGYLSIMARQNGYTHIDATDNNAAALLACQANFVHYQISGEVFPDDHGEYCQKRYDTILCNPPFHQGFGHHKNLTEIFVAQSEKLLSSGGQAWFVVNQFIGIEKIADQHYKKCELLAKKNGFKVFLFEKK